MADAGQAFESSNFSLSVRVTEFSVTFKMVVLSSGIPFFSLLTPPAPAIVQL